MTRNREESSVNRTNIVQDYQAQWFILNPNGSERIVNFGAPGLSDIPIAGDFDGVGHDEIGVYRPSTGQWTPTIS